MRVRSSVISLVEAHGLQRKHKNPFKRAPPSYLVLIMLKAPPSNRMDAYENADANRPHAVWTYLFGRHLTEKWTRTVTVLRECFVAIKGVAELDLLEDVPQKQGWSDNIRDNIEGGPAELERQRRQRPEMVAGGPSENCKVECTPKAERHHDKSAPKRAAEME